MPELKDIIVYILTFTSITVSGIFSYLLYSVSKKAADASKLSAQLTEVTLELNKKINELEMKKEENLTKAMRELYLSRLKNQLYYIMSFLKIEDIKKIIKFANFVPISHGIPEDDLVRYFDRIEALKLDQSFELLREYLLPMRGSLESEIKLMELAGLEFNYEKLDSHARKLREKAINEFTNLMDLLNLDMEETFFSMKAP